MFSGAKIPIPTITYPLEFTWIKQKKKTSTNKQHVEKSLCPTEMLWIELIMFFQFERNIKQSRNRKGQIQSYF